MSIEFDSVIMAHGKPSKERYDDPRVPKPHKANWLYRAKTLYIAAGKRAYLPALPRPYDPHHGACIAELVRHEPIDRRTLLEGHSSGVYHWLRWLSENPSVEVAGFIGVASWLNPNGKYEGLPPFEIDRGLVERCVGGLIFFYSSLDDDQAKRSLAIIQRALPDATYIDIPDYGHFQRGNIMMTDEFPELMDLTL